MMFVTPIILTIQGHMFAIYTMVSEIYENIDLVLGVKNFIKFKEKLSIKISISFFKQINFCAYFAQGNSQTNGKKLLKVEAPF